MAGNDPSAPDVMCKVGDFGESRFVVTSGQGRENLANPLWLAPEVMKGGEYTEKCDVYRYYNASHNTPQLNPTPQQHNSTNITTNHTIVLQLYYGNW